MSRREGAPDCAVIVAAGVGSRLRHADQPPKPLLPVLRVPLIERVMRAAARAGIRRFVVVIGYQAEAMRAALPALVPEGATLTLVENPRYEEPNGVSLAAALDVVAGSFALLMADHLFTPDRLEAALAQHVGTGRCLLVVEERERFQGDMADATRVRVEDGRITAIEKELAAFDAVDTGMFVLTASQTRAALESAGPSPSISDGMRVLARDGQLDALTLRHGRWQDVDTPQDVDAAEELLFDSLRKPNDGFLATHVNRRISLALTRRLGPRGVAPNAATLVTLLVGLAAGWVFAQGSGVLLGLIGATLFQMQSILDGVDGELARLLHRESRLGFWLDVCADNVTHMAVFAGIAHGQAVDGPQGPWELLGVLAVLGVAAAFLTMAPLLRQDRSPKPGDAPGRTLRRLADGLARRDFTYALFPLAAFGWLAGFLWAAAVGTWAYAALVGGLRLARRGRLRRAAA